MQEQIEREISKNLTGEMRETALKFTAFLKSHGLMFHRDRSGDWAEKIYYWARSDKNCVCFIAVKDPDEPENAWTVWSDDSAAYEAPLGDAETSEIGRDAQTFAEALVMHNLALAQELDGVAHIGIIRKAQDIVIRYAGLLLGG